MPVTRHARRLYDRLGRVLPDQTPAAIRELVEFLAEKAALDGMDDDQLRTQLASYLSHMYGCRTSNDAMVWQVTTQWVSEMEELRWRVSHPTTDEVAEVLATT